MGAARLVLKAAVLLILGVGLFSLFLVPLRTDEVRMDALTGSTQQQTFWPRRMTFGPAFTPSPLELRLRKLGVKWTPRWTFICGPERTVFGSTVVNVCGSPPPIYSMHGAMQWYVDNASDAEVLELVRILQFGTESQQRAAVDAAFKKALQ
jgi:hypothetical protein